MTTPDLLCLAFVAFVMLFDHLVVWRSFLRRWEVDPDRARLGLYRALVGELWAMVAGVVALWLYAARPWASLKLIAPIGWRLWGSLALCLAITIALVASVVRVVRLKRRKRVKVRGHAMKHAPRTRRELAWWSVVSLSAACSEELIFRGYLIWAFQPLLGLWGAAALSLAVFAAAHTYNGVVGVVGAGVVGAFLTAVVLVSGSLWPAVAIHLVLDLQQGLAAWLVLQAAPDAELAAAPAVPANPG